MKSLLKLNNLQFGPTDPLKIKWKTYQPNSLVMNEKHNNHLKYKVAKPFFPAFNIINIFFSILQSNCIGLISAVFFQ